MKLQCMAEEMTLRQIRTNITEFTVNNQVMGGRKRDVTWFAKKMHMHTLRKG